MHSKDITKEMLDAKHFTDLNLDWQSNDIFEHCPVCHSKEVGKLRADWQGFGEIDIIGCGNPWHYATKSLGDSD